MKAVLWYLAWFLILFWALEALFPGFGIGRYIVASSLIPFLDRLANLPWDRR